MGDAYQARKNRFKVILLAGDQHFPHVSSLTHFLCWSLRMREKFPQTILSSKAHP